MVYLLACLLDGVSIVSHTGVCVCVKMIEHSAHHCWFASHVLDLFAAFVVFCLSVTYLCTMSNHTLCYIPSNRCITRYLVLVVTQTTQF